MKPQSRSLHHRPEKPCQTATVQSARPRVLASAALIERLAKLCLPASLGAGLGSSPCAARSDDSSLMCWRQRGAREWKGSPRCGNPSILSEMSRLARANESGWRISSPTCAPGYIFQRRSRMSQMGQSTKSLRSSPLRGSKSREAGSQVRGQRWRGGKVNTISSCIVGVLAGRHPDAASHIDPAITQ